MRHRTALNRLYPDQTNRWKATHSAQVGVGVQGGSGLWSPPLRSVSEYLILVYSRPLILLFWNEEAKTSQDKSATVTQRHRRSWCWFHMAAWKWNVTLTGSSKTDEYNPPAPPLCGAAVSLCNAELPCRWSGTGPQSAPFLSAVTAPSGSSWAHQYHSPLLAI